MKNIVNLIKRVFIIIGNFLIHYTKSVIHYFRKLISNTGLSELKQKYCLIAEFINNKIKNKDKPEVYEEKENQKWRPKYAETSVRRIKRASFSKVRIFLLGVVCCVVFIGIPLQIILWLETLPSPELLVTKDVPTPSKILDRKGRLLFEIFIDKRYEPVKLEVIPKHFVNATIAVEDDKFYKHAGFDPLSMIRAAKSIFIEDKLEGGSTITQQLIKNVLLSPERTVSRKIKELILSVLAEAKYSKEEILEMYLNNISYGGTAWGVQSASQKFFGKNVWDLDLAESALLAGLPSSPSTYSPLSGDQSLAKSRQKYVLERMQQLGYITTNEADEAFNKKLNFVTQVEYIRAPHFVAYVRSELEKTYGKRFVELGGLTIHTTLDLDLQDEAQKIVTEEVAASSGLLISNGAAVVLDAVNREILAYVGSTDYFKEGWGAFDVASAYRQPGSSIKPLTYVLALEKGFTTSSILKDEPITYKFSGQAPYTPKNYDGKDHGDVTLRTALANSYNIPAVRLAHRLGPDNIVKLGQEFGLSNWKVDGSYGLSITLGGKEVRLLDHTNFYASLARLGKYKPTTPFISIKDNKGFELYRNNNQEQKIVSPESAYMIWHILSDNNARVPAFGTHNSLVINGKKVAVKTGTTDNIRDNFTMGYTPSYVVGVWVGNNDNSPLHRNLASGLSGAAPIWNKIMTAVLKDKQDELMQKPDSIFEKYDEKCGRGDIFAKGTKIPERLCPEEKKDEADRD